MKVNIFLLTAMLACSACSQKKEINDFVRIENSQFIVNGEPYYFIGTNFWYGAILGSTGEGGDRKRLCRELDYLKANGIDNLRILIGADGPNGVTTKVEPTLQQAQGVYNDTIFDGLDFLLSEMGKRSMYAVLYFTNSWEWSGGYGQYLEWSGRGKAPIPAVDGWSAYMEFVKQYAACDSCHEMLKQHIKTVISRTNRYTSKKYTDDPAIFSWQIGNEPRAFSDENKPLFTAWLKDIAAFIKSLDTNHLVSVGSEGKHGCEQDVILYEEIHADPNIDYLTAHIWPKNWSWIDPDNITETLDSSIIKTKKYINEHIAVAERLKKPLVIEEFGFPRDMHQYSPSSTTILRDAYYAAMFDEILLASEHGGVFAGCNFWAWGGFGRPQHVFWQKGDDYLGDPAQEEQGLNAVFDHDATVNLVKRYVANIRCIPPLADLQATPATQELSRRMKRLLEKGVMFGHQDDTAYGHDWYGENGRSDVRDVTGDYPAVIGWELGHVELGVDCNLDSIYFSDMKRLMCENHTRGGINTVSWHGDNIVTGKTAWDCAQDYVVKSVLDGDNHEKFLTWLDRLADFFLDLKDENGELLPVIFRMYHEHTGAWFWWGARQCTPDEYSELYRMTVSYLRDVRNVHNLLYAFSPADVLSEADFLSRYPGDNWVDIIGFDTYCADNRDEYRKKVTSGLTVLTNYAARTGQIPVLAETGLEGITDSTFFSETLLPLIKPFKIGYVLCWRNAFNRPEHFYVPYKGHPAEQDFLKFVNSEQILMNKDL